VQIQRRIDKAIDTYSRRTGKWISYAIGTHGNRLVAALVFGRLPTEHLRTPSTDIDELASEDRISQDVDVCLATLAGQVELLYPNSIIPTLFKNLKKCEHLAAETRKVLDNKVLMTDITPG
jgi:hypothetical protein